MSDVAASVAFRMTTSLVCAQEKLEAERARAEAEKMAEVRHRWAVLWAVLCVVTPALCGRVSSWSGKRGWRKLHDPYLTEKLWMALSWTQSAYARIPPPRSWQLSWESATQVMHPALSVQGGACLAGFPRNDACARVGDVTQFARAGILAF